MFTIIIGISIIIETINYIIDIEVQNNMLKLLQYQ